MKLTISVRSLLLLLSVIIPALLPCAGAGEQRAGLHNEYFNARFRLFRDEKFVCEITADKADATNVDQRDPKVNMTGVSVEIFESSLIPAGDTKPPLKVRITSDRGTYMSALDPASKQMQDIVVLEGNVVVLRYQRVQSAEAVPELESTLRCDQARWNNSTGVLNGSGNVQMAREDGTLKLGGEGMIYEIDKEKQGGLDIDMDTGQMGGLLEIQRNVRMEVRQKNAAGLIDNNTLTTVTSGGSGRYDFDRGEMLFRTNVNVTRSNMRIACDRLKLLLAEEDSTGSRFREMFAESAADGVVDISGKGNPNDPRDRNIGEWRASARYARYKEEAGELLLTDDRPDFLPLARLENNIIRNNTVLFYIREERLFATGENGETIINADDAPLPAGGVREEKVVVRFKERLFYDQRRNVAQFTKDVRLSSAGLQMDAQKLVVDFAMLSAADGARASKLRKLTASDDVRLLYQNRKARCAQLEMVPNPEPNPQPDASGRVMLDQYTMSGTPLPEIELPGGGYFQARQIVTTRYLRPDTGQRTVHITAAGPGSGLFGGGSDAQGAPSVPTADAMTIRYSNNMYYDELDDKVDFHGEVTATRSDQVLRSDRLLAWLVPSAGQADHERKEIQRLTAVGNANMHWGLNHCEASSIDRRISAGGRREDDKITLFGTASRPARIWEENGASFQGTQITAASDGSAIYSQGGGELMMLDRNTNEKAMVSYSSDAYYRVMPNSDSYAIFRGNVVMRRGNMKVTGDKMRADLELVKGATPGMMPDMSVVADSGVSSATLPRRLKRVTVESNVVIRQGNRVAFGNKGQVDIGEEGDVMLLEGKENERAEINDNNGFTLFAPRVMVREAAGTITAAGPGEVRIAGAGSAASVGMDTSGLGVGGGNYQLLYGGRLLYNMVGRTIKFEQDVRLNQEALYGTCQQLTVFLSHDGAGRAGAEERIKVDNIECLGNVRFTRLPEPPAGRNPFALPGRTVLTKSQQAHYDAKSNVILLTTPGAQAHVILQEISANGRPSARYLQSAERVWVNTISGEINVTDSNNRQQIVPLSPGGPLKFPDDP